MTEEMPGQMVLFGVSKQMADAVRHYADTFADRRWQEDQGHGPAVGRAQKEHRKAVEELERLGFPVDNSW